MSWIKWIIQIAINFPALIRVVKDIIAAIKYRPDPSEKEKADSDEEPQKERKGIFRRWRERYNLIREERKSNGRN